MANNDATQIKLGACSVEFNGVDLGYTIGGVEVEVSTETHETKVDQFGETIVNEYITNRTVKAKVPLAETTLENLVLVMPGAEALVTSGTTGNKMVVVKDGTGVSLRDTALKLVLKPKLGTEDEWFTIPLAQAPGALNYAYKANEERVFMCDFKGYPAADGTLFIMGDETAVA